jgi:hypothetical protein
MKAKKIKFKTDTAERKTKEEAKKPYKFVFDTPALKRYLASNPKPYKW